MCGSDNLNPNYELPQTEHLDWWSGRTLATRVLVVDLRT